MTLKLNGQGSVKVTNLYQARSIIIRQFPNAKVADLFQDGAQGHYKKVFNQGIEIGVVLFGDD